MCINFPFCKVLWSHNIDIICSWEILYSRKTKIFVFAPSSRFLCSTARGNWLCKQYVPAVPPTHHTINISSRWPVFLTFVARLQWLMCLPSTFLLLPLEIKQLIGQMLTFQEKSEICYLHGRIELVNFILSPPSQVFSG